jgi:hypothetical protein
MQDQKFLWGFQPTPTIGIALGIKQSVTIKAAAHKVLALQFIDIHLVRGGIELWIKVTMQP